MTATDVLRQLLDERGVEYFKHEDGEPLRKLEKADEPATSWHMDGASVCAVPIEGSDLFDLWIDHCTPEQAIEATLDSCSRSSNCTNGERTNGTCRDVRSADHIIAFECSECGCWVAYDEYWETGIYVPDETGQEHIHPRYCPNCGAEVGA